MRRPFFNPTPPGACSHRLAGASNYPAVFVFAEGCWGSLCLGDVLRVCFGVGFALSLCPSCPSFARLCLLPLPLSLSLSSTAAAAAAAAARAHREPHRFVVTQWTPGGDDPAVPFLIHVKTSIDEVTSAKSRRIVVNPESIERALGKACAMLREREDKENRAPVDYSQMNKWQRLVHTWMPCTKWVNEDTGESFDLTRLKDLDDLQMHARNGLNNGYLTLIVARRTLPGLVDEVRATAAGKRSWASYLGPPPLPGSVRANYLPCFDESAIINRGLEWLSLFVIIVSVVGFCVESLPEYRLHDDGTERNTPPNALYALDATCIGLFTFEYLWRVTCGVGATQHSRRAAGSSSSGWWWCWCVWGRVHETG